MKRVTRRNLIWVVVAFVIVTGVLLSSFIKKDMGPCTKYKCDVKNFRLSTTINISKEGRNFAKVKGNILKFITDPLTMYDLNERKIAYASDAYHFIAQDSHLIYANDELPIEMVGRFKVFGEAYDIYDENQNKIAKVTFNAFNTKGRMYDREGTLIADYNSFFLFKDFNVRISEKCNLNEKAVLMIFCSYYSDQATDAKVAANQNSSK